MSSGGIGLYLHVPFCAGKCPYCDFYSVRATEAAMDDYTDCLVRRVREAAERTGRRADTLYLGGGTPSLLGAARLCRILGAARESFSIGESAEVTVEANPGELSAGFFREIRAAGANRVSLGVQSTDDGELRLLGRRHTARDAARAAEDAREAGFANLSLDLMLAVQGQTPQSLARSVEFCARAGAAHVSAYLLQIEPRTAYWKNRAQLRLPDEDGAARLYLLACSELEKRGFRQYEISNFARPGFEGRHNLNYWRCGEYLGLGPSAHSFLDGKRFHFPRGMAAFLRGDPPEQDGPGGDFEEYAMLKLRLAEGLSDAGCRARFGHPIPEPMKRAARRYGPNGWVAPTADGFRLTPAGFLLSDALTVELLQAEPARTARRSVRSGS